MKTFLLLVVMLFLWSLPTAVQSYDIPADLREKNISERVRSNQKMNDRLSAKQGRKGIDDCLKQQSKNQTEMNKVMNNMRERTAPLAK